MKDPKKAAAMKAIRVGKSGTAIHAGWPVDKIDRWGQPFVSYRPICTSERAITNTHNVNHDPLRRVAVVEGQVTCKKCAEIMQRDGLTL